MKIIKPKAIKSGDTFGIVACSTPITASSEETIERAYQRIRDRGFNIVEAPNCRKIHGHAAGTIKERVKALHDFFRNPKIDGILHYWGGYQSHQLLEYLDPIGPANPFL
jgi:muramoyltetrapeptide carboxypeptidase